MEEDLFSILPREITINILSRLPVRSTARCKCVRKSWRSLIDTTEFVKSYKSFPGLAVFQGKESSKQYKVYEFEVDEHDRNPWNEVFNFSVPHPDLIHSSANGLLLLLDHKIMPHKLVLCNPVTREFINLPNPQASSWIQFGPFGFGVSKTTGQYKLVKIFHRYHESDQPSHLERDRGSHCQVYTLGTGSWRSIAPSGPPLVYDNYSVGASLNGNFHCLASDFRGYLWISCFDLETELFSAFAPPHLDAPRSRDRKDFISLSALRGCLGLCDNAAEHEIVIWLMNTYGDGKSWTRQFVISTRNLRSDFYGVVYAIKVFANGNILIKKEVCSEVLCYSDKTKSIRGTDLIDSRIHDRYSAVCYSPSFLPLKSFPMENVSSF